MRVFITGLGAYAPPRVVANTELAAALDTTDEWIREHLGIRERRVADDTEPTSTMGERAARSAMQSAGVTPGDLDGLVVATQTPDKPIPATACIIHGSLGCGNAFAFDINAACPGFAYALYVVHALLSSGMANRVLAVGTERMSRLVDWGDRRTCVIFGDGAGAAVLEGSVTAPPTALAEVLDVAVHADGSRHMMISVEAGGSSRPITAENAGSPLQYVRMDGRAVFDFAVGALAESISEICARSGLSPRDLTYVLPHQANSRIIQQGMRLLGLPETRALSIIETHANTSAASLPMLLAAHAKGTFSRGDMLGLSAFGTGLTWGSALIRWIAEDSVGS
jgi:3-oxoacyl-[acyl-carrier-protein] synthase-3